MASLGFLMPPGSGLGGTLIFLCSRQAPNGGGGGGVLKKIPSGGEERPTTRSKPVMQHGSINGRINGTKRITELLHAVRRPLVGRET